MKPKLVNTKVNHSGNGEMMWRMEKNRSVRRISLRATLKTVSGKHFRDRRTEKSSLKCVHHIKRAAVQYLQCSLVVCWHFLLDWVVFHVSWWDFVHTHTQRTMFPLQEVNTSPIIRKRAHIHLNVLLRPHFSLCSMMCAGLQFYDSHLCHFVPMFAEHIV